MLINVDFSTRAAVVTDLQPWVPSPQPGVDRRMLDRVGLEKARATSLVRYAPAASYPAHEHPGGEEILVLSGVFAEDGRHHPAGTYLRNPPGSAHQPASPEGAVIFVKLWQMNPAEQTAVCINTRDAAAWHTQADRTVCPLYEGFGERVRLLRLAPGGRVLPEGNDAGAELFVLQGSLLEAGHASPQGTWLRLPPGDGLGVEAGPHGAELYLKTGHLRELIDSPPA